MPRKSLAELSTTVVDTRHIRLAPPSHLSEAAAAVWCDLVAAVGPEHFTRADGPLLEQYAVACVMARRAADALERDGEVIDGKASPWLVIQEKSVRALVALSARLRVCPQSRFDRLKAGTNARKPGPRGVAALLEMEDE
ncbi:MAG: P27 family phage terminase small subunit [Pseudomonadales bacterium]